MAGRTAIGLDIGTTVVRAVELSYGRGGVTLERLGQVVLPMEVVRDGEVIDVDAVATAIRQLWSATQFSHKRVVIGVANRRVLVRQVELPELERDEMRESLSFHVQDVLPFPVEQAVLDFLPLQRSQDREGSRSVRGLLVAADRDTVLANVECATRAGLSVTAVDLPSFALLRALGKQRGTEYETEALIDIGARVTNVVVHSDGEPRFARILLVGGQDITDAIAEALGVSTGQAEAMKQGAGLGPESGAGREAEVTQAAAGTVQDLVDEIRGSLDYYATAQSGPTVQRVLISGGGSRMPWLIDQLGTALRLPVIAGDPMVNLRIGRTGLNDQQLEFIRPLAAVPIGLALGAL